MTSPPVEEPTREQLIAIGALAIHKSLYPRATGKWAIPGTHSYQLAEAVVDALGIEYVGTESQMTNPPKPLFDVFRFRLRCLENPQETP